LATIPAAVRGRELYGGRLWGANQPREAGDSVWETERMRRTSLKHAPPFCFSSRRCWTAAVVSSSPHPRAVLIRLRVGGDADRYM